MKRRRFFITLVLVIAVHWLKGQEMDIHILNTPLNKALIQLRDRHHFQFSFNDQLLSSFNVTCNGHYDSPDAVVADLIHGLPLRMKKQGGVFVIFPETHSSKRSKYSFSGVICEGESNEVLPFSNIEVNNRIVSSDLKGSFSFVDESDSLFHAKITHLGYFPLDTVLSAGVTMRIRLTPSRIGLREIVIKNETPDHSTQIGRQAGSIKVNHQIARYLPGSEDNSVFNLLRLMPGILASSEQLNGLVVWGAYEGQSQVLFDGFTVWGLKAFSVDIDAVNPLMAKEIEVLKGGYDVSQGDRIAALVRIEGKSGNFRKPSFSLDLNNATANSLIEVPIGSKSSVIVSYRNTYNNLIDKDGQTSTLSLPSTTEVRKTPAVDFTVHPDYSYKDANLKFTSQTNRGDLFFLSLMGGQDRYNYSLNQTQNRNRLEKSSKESNDQFGGSLFFGRNWQSGNRSNLSFSWSGLESTYDDAQKLSRNSGISLSQKAYKTINNVQEYTLKSDQIFHLNETNNLEFGGGFIGNSVHLLADSSGIIKTNTTKDIGRLNGYFQDHLILPGNLDIHIGLRADYPTQLNKVYFQPRINTRLNLSGEWKLNAAWGWYNQFVTRSAVLDNAGNNRYIWTTCDNKDISVPKAVHWVLGTGYYRNELTFNVEGYYRFTRGLTRFINYNQKINDLIFKGEGRSYGLDLFLKKEYRGHSAWISYSLSKTEERFGYFNNLEYRVAPQDQRHELKLATLIQLKPLFLSASYVYGSGFPLNEGTLLNPVYIRPSYNRFDLALNCRFKMGKVMGEGGVSILNLFDNKNVMNSNFEKVTVDQSTSLSIFSEAVPFSPRVALRIFY